MKRLKKVGAVCLLAAVAIGIGMFIMQAERADTATNAGRVSQLFDDLTTTPERQQLAMDELVSAGDVALPFMFSHLNDRRRLATQHLMFLNSSPTVSEKYFNTLAVSVDEATLRYLCWHTASCDFDFDEDDHENRSVQIQKVFEWCKTAFAASAAQCDTLKQHGAIEKR